MNSVDDRIRAALHAAVDGLQEQDLRPADPPTGFADRRRPVRWIAPLLAAAAVVVAAAVTVAITSSPSAHGPGPAGNPSSGRSAPSSGSVTSTPAPPLGGDEPLWPFATLGEADHWKNVDAANGHSPWHADAKATALFFAQNYLQFHDITKVTSTDIRGARADIGVGYDLPSGAPHTASVIHLVLFGDDSGPWEVTGASAEGFSITQPAYGKRVSSPMTVAGRITGSDESITVAVRTIDGSVDTLDPLPAGGDNAPWSRTVAFSEHGVLTMVASTGGHLTAHERFAVVGVEADG
ncbi:MAG: hypothetical protein QOH89_720 [Pseudonocardiales bacterium]|nr:hypothetical protein [Pseudonocardiales bacterium]